MTRRWGTFSHDGLKRFAKNLERLDKALPGFFEKSIQEAALRLLAKAKAKTFDETGELQRKWTAGQVRKISGGWQVEVFHSVQKSQDPDLWDAVRFILTISEEELERELPAILAKDQKAFLKKFLG